jgi:hypothetical protein
MLEATREEPTPLQAEVFLGVVFVGMIGLTGTGEAVVLPPLATQILWIKWPSGHTRSHLPRSWYR